LGAALAATSVYYHGQVAELLRSLNGSMQLFAGRYGLGSEYPRRCFDPRTLELTITANPPEPSDREDGSDQDEEQFFGAQEYLE
jgi:hypothetical protein